ncbi:MULTISPECIES: hypothetical protein [Sphingomonas]|jgi:hypothetical protein|uniref:hypothetical protein n=1 Tax=Sphingomonas TaxID=13687 RepID=UPI001AEEA7F1|nr:MULTISPECIES: hypothetical protein [Sphingomonas]
MVDTKLPSFDNDKIAAAIRSAQEHHEEHLQALRTTDASKMTLTDGALKLAGGCIDVTVTNGKICINLPLGIGSKCLPVPGWIPNGTVAKACISICTKWGIPCGVEVSVTVAGVTVVKQGFGCSC